MIVFLLACEPTLKDADGETGLQSTDDTACQSFTIFQDLDGDGHGDRDVTQESCTLKEGWSITDDDEDDENADCWQDCPDYECYEMGTYTHGAGDSADPVQEATWHVCVNPAAWGDARLFCQTWLGGDLLTFAKEGKLETMEGLSADYLDISRMYWVGLTQASGAPSVDFGWSWTSNQGLDQGELTSETINEGGVWHQGQPNNAGFEEGKAGADEEDVGALEYRQEQWALGDQNVDSQRAFFCEIYSSE